jgi:hypothetical protein
MSPRGRNGASSASCAWLNLWATRRQVFHLRLRVGVLAGLPLGTMGVNQDAMLEGGPGATEARSISRLVMV